MGEPKKTEDNSFMETVINVGFVLEILSTLVIILLFFLPIEQML